MAQPDLDVWGDLALDTSFDSDAGPAALLREQAARLGQKTNGLVTARVDSYRKRDRLGYTLFLKSPALEEFSHRLLSIEHGVEPYPVEVPGLGGAADDDWGKPLVDTWGEPVFKPLVFANEAEFTKFLSKTLSSSETHRTISRLAAYARDVARPRASGF
jgi:hypothetical protein